MLGLAGDRHHARHGLNLAVERRRVLLGAGVPEARKRAIDQPGIDGLERRITQAQLVHHAGPEVLPHDVGIQHHALDHLDGGGLLQIEHHAFLVAVHRHEGRGHLLARQILVHGDGARVVTLRRLDLDDFRPLQRELVRAERA
ncbi:hypothetical protein SDC9_104780 [bioreactor metagenome]|uniref:Uncharacterized protein n=1 Tax=bioreactor metagenome TaxID=1076179 RepID=A0A645B059_9ZZZZ